MPRTPASLSQFVLRFYLRAPLSEIEQIQPSLKEVYDHRQSLADRSREAVAEKKADKAPKVRKPRKYVKKQKETFGGKEIVPEGEVTA